MKTVGPWRLNEKTFYVCSSRLPYAHIVNNENSVEIRAEARSFLEPHINNLIKALPELGRKSCNLYSLLRRTLLNSDKKLSKTGPSDDDE